MVLTIPAQIPNDPSCGLQASGARPGPRPPLENVPSRRPRPITHTRLRSTTGRAAISARRRPRPRGAHPPLATRPQRDRPGLWQRRPPQNPWAPGARLHRPRAHVGARPQWYTLLPPRPMFRTERAFRLGGKAISATPAIPTTLTTPAMITVAIEGKGVVGRTFLLRC